jgi:hypothetical protein
MPNRNKAAATAAAAAAAAPKSFDVILFYGNLMGVLINHILQVNEHFTT